MKLPKIGNQAAPGTLVGPDPRQAGRDFDVTLSGLSKVNRARMSEIANTGAAARQAMVSSSNLKMNEQKTNIVIANAESTEARGIARGGALAAAGIRDVGRSIQAYQAREEKTEGKNHVLRVKEFNAQWTKAHGGQIEFNANEIPDAVREAVGIGANETVVPAYKVSAEWRRHDVQQFMAASALQVSDEQMREDVLNVTKGLEITQYANDLNQAFSDQPIYIKTKTLEKYNALVDNGQFDLAITLIESSDLKKGEKIDLLDKTFQQKQDHDLTSIESLDPTDPTTIIHQQRAADRMREERAAGGNGATTGALSEAQFRQHLNALDRKVKDAKAGAVKQGEAQFSLLKEEGQINANAMWTGQVLGTERTDEIIKILKTEGSGPSLKVARDMIMAQAHAKSVHAVNRLPIANQRGYQRELEQKMVGKDPLTQKAFQKQIDAIDAGVEQRRNDPVKWSMENNIMPYKGMDYNDLAGSLRSRVINANAMTSTYQSPWELMTKTERTEFTALYEEADTSGKLQMMADVTVGMGGDIVKAGAFWEPFKSDGEMGTGSTAGQLMALGNRVGATKVLEGKLIRAKAPEYFHKDVKDDLNTFLVPKLGSIIRGNDVERRMIMDAVYDVVAYDNKKNYDSTGILDEGRALAALNIVTGGVVDYHGSYIQTPAGLTPVATSCWLNDQAAEAYAETGHPEEVKKRLDNGSLKIVGVGQNLFQITDDKGDVVMNTKTNSPFEFGYYDDYPSIKAQAPATDLDVSGGKDFVKAKSIWERDTKPLLRKWGIID